MSESDNHPWQNDFAVPQVAAVPDLLLGFRFAVFFSGGGNDPIDTRFQKVSGLSATVKTTPLVEGGQNLYTQQLPSGIQYGNLVLERGMVVKSQLNTTFDAALRLYQFAPTNVTVILYDQKMGLDKKTTRQVLETNPVAAWQFIRAFPVKWSTSNLDATQKNLLIDTMELAYANMQILSL